MTLVRPHLRETPHSGIRRMMEIAWATEDALLLVSGDPNFSTPGHIIDGAAALAHGGATGYGPGEGFLPLREEISAKLARVNQVEASPDEICVTTGACGGLFTSLMLTVEPGADVLLPDPGWSNYAAMIHVLGGNSVGYPVGAGTNWRLDPATIEAAITPATSVLVLNSPSNPTGVVFEPADLAAVVELATGRGITVVSDEAYDQIVYDRAPYSPASEISSDHLVTVYSFSKTYAMTGWRIGYVVGGADFIRELSLHQEPVVSSASTISQHGALTALRGPQDCVGEMVEAYRTRCRRAVELLDAVAIPHVEPGGSFFLFADVRTTGMTSWDFAEALIADTKVAVVPGAAFGPGGEGFVRISLAASLELIEEGIGRMAEAVERYRQGAPAARPS